MRIVSEVKDYFDCIQASGQDQGLLYVRKPKLINLDKWPFPLLSNYSNNVYLRQHVIGFCGKLYPVFQITKVGKQETIALPENYLMQYHKADERLTTCLNLEEVDAYIESKTTSDERAAYRAKSWRGNLAWPWWLRRAEFVKHFKAFEDCNKKVRPELAVDGYGWFEEHRCPIFIATKHYRRTQLVINGILKDLDFMRQFDPYQAFQEVSMFLGNMAMPEKVIPHVDDKTMAGAKGFDKWSFRKEPTKKG